jgi:hypothetical protein
VVGRTVVVVVTSDVVEAPVVVLVTVVVPDEDDDDVVLVLAPDEPDLEDAVVPVAVAVRRGCSLPRMTTISPPSVGSRPRGDSAMLACVASRAATAAPIKAPKASRPDPPNAVSIVNDYRPHSFGSNPPGQLVPVRYFGYRTGTSCRATARVSPGGSRSA